MTIGRFGRLVGGLVLVSLITEAAYAASITVSEPTAGAVWEHGTTHSIRWNPPADVANVAISLYKGTTVPSAVIVHSTPNDGEYTWTIPASATAGTDRRIRVGSTSNPTGVFGFSQLFTIPASQTRIIRLEGDLDFGNVTIGQFKQKFWTIYNDGDSTLTITSITYPTGFRGYDSWGGDFTIAPDDSADVYCDFVPAEARSYSGTITVTSDKTSGTNTISCSGTGTPPEGETRIIRLEGDLAFGNVTVGRSDVHTMYIYNDGTATLNVSGYICPAGFSISTVWSGALLPGDRHPLPVTFSPGAEQTYGGTITVNSDKTDGTSTIACSGTGARGEAPVHFADANLKAAVEEALGITDPTPADMLTITELDAAWQSVHDLTGLEEAANLTRLFLQGNETINDLSPLSGLSNLTFLDLYYNRVSDVTPLSGLTSLTWLNLDRNEISDIDPLAGLTDLAILDLRLNQISDISPLTGFTHLTKVLLNANPLNAQAYTTHIPLIQVNNPGIQIYYDPWSGETRIIRLEPLFGDLSFGNVEIGKTSEERYFNIWNDGNSDLTVTAVSYPEGFDGYTLPGSVTIPPGDKVMTSIRFKPMEARSYIGDIVVSSNATSGTNTIACSGTGLGIPTAKKYTLTLSSTSWGSVTTPGEGTFEYEEGTRVTIKAVADAGYSFVKWVGTAVTAGKVADPDSATTSVEISGDYSLTAHFADIFAGTGTLRIDVTDESGRAITGFRYVDSPIVPDMVEDPWQEDIYVREEGDLVGPVYTGIETRLECEPHRYKQVTPKIWVEVLLAETRNRIASFDYTGPTSIEVPAPGRYIVRAMTTFQADIGITEAETGLLYDACFPYFRDGSLYTPPFPDPSSYYKEGTDEGGQYEFYYVKAVKKNGMLAFQYSKRYTYQVLGDSVTYVDVDEQDRAHVSLLRNIEALRNACNAGRQAYSTGNFAELEQITPPIGDGASEATNAVLRKKMAGIIEDALGIPKTDPAASLVASEVAAFVYAGLFTDEEFRLDDAETTAIKWGAGRLICYIAGLSPTGPWGYIVAIGIEIVLQIPDVYHKTILLDAMRTACVDDLVILMVPQGGCPIGS